MVSSGQRRNVLGDPTRGDCWVRTIANVTCVMGDSWVGHRMVIPTNCGVGVSLVRTYIPTQGASVDFAEAMVKPT